MGSGRAQAGLGRSRRTFPCGPARSSPAGDLVFYGTMDGWFKAVDARTGAPLWQYKVDSGIIGQPISYEGRTAINTLPCCPASAAGRAPSSPGPVDPRDGSAALGMVNAMSDLPKYTTAGGTLYVFALPHRARRWPLLASRSADGLQPRRRPRSADSLPHQQRSAGVIASALDPGRRITALVTTDPRAAQYYDNADAVKTGKRLFASIQLLGMPLQRRRRHGPVADGRRVDLRRPAGADPPDTGGRVGRTACPPGAARYRIEQLWQISAYVRSMSLPQTLAAQNGADASQTPAPVPRAADQDPGWTPPPGTTNDYTATLEGP